MGCFGSKSKQRKIKAGEKMTDFIEEEPSVFEDSKQDMSKSMQSENSRVICKVKTMRNVYRITLNNYNETEATDSKREIEINLKNEKKNISAHSDLAPFE